MSEVGPATSDIADLSAPRPGSEHVEGSEEEQSRKENKEEDNDQIKITEDEDDDSLDDGDDGYEGVRMRGPPGNHDWFC